MLDEDGFHVPARYPDRISAGAPNGLRADAKRAAEVEHINYSEFIRRAVEQRVQQVLSSDAPAADSGNADNPGAPCR